MKKKMVFLYVKTFIITAVSILLIFLGVMAIYIFAYEISTKHEKYGYNFSSDMNFDLDLHTKTIKLTSTGKILILTDIHFLSSSNKTKKMVRNIVDEKQPEMIVLAGDQCFTPFNHKAYKEIIELFDSFKIPWAPIFGNHDNFGPASKDVLSDLFLDSKYCLYDYGPSNFKGAGTYVINIQVDGDIVHSFIMMDTHTDKILDDPALEVEQIAWYEWIIKGLQAEIDDNIETTVFVHVPIPEFVDAYEKGEVIYGQMGEDSCVQTINTGLFEKIRELQSTINIISGHDHLNNYWAVYEGVCFMYATKTGYGSYGDKNLSGYIIFVLDENLKFVKEGYLV